MPTKEGGLGGFKEIVIYIYHNLIALRNLSYDMFYRIHAHVNIVAANTVGSK